MIKLTNILREIKIKAPQVSTIDSDVEDLIREYINKEIDKLAVKEIKSNNTYFLDYLNHL
jgi:tRNA A-37 threonylcarbamoyl transferase component Bud32